MVSKYVDGIHEERFDNFLADLRSGDFDQTSGRLERLVGGEVAGRCCLGVACVRPYNEGLIGRSVSEYGTVKYEGNSADLPKAVADYLGIPEENRSDLNGDTDINFFKSGFGQDPDGCHKTATGLNDWHQLNFAEIADAFELEFTREA